MIKNKYNLEDIRPKAMVGTSLGISNYSGSQYKQLANTHKVAGKAANKLKDFWVNSSLGASYAENPLAMSESISLGNDGKYHIDGSNFMPTKYDVDWNKVDKVANVADDVLAITGLVSWLNPYTRLAQAIAGTVVDGYQLGRAIYKNDKEEISQNATEIVLNILGAKYLKRLNKKNENGVQLRGAQARNARQNNVTNYKEGVSPTPEQKRNIKLQLDRDVLDYGYPAFMNAANGTVHFKFREKDFINSNIQNNDSTKNVNKIKLNKNK